MSRKIKRQLQISKLPRKKGYYISKDQAETELKAVEKRTEKENLKEFQKVEKKLITEILCWHENAMSIRIAYNGTSKTTTWKNKKKEELTHNAKEMRMLDTLFRNTKLQSLQPQFSFPFPPLFFETQNPSLITKEATSKDGHRS
ncbi:unnamed protein product [Rhizophagus irregularis]|nr:unnamed protein product [Rhizophagus irregularis]